MRAPEQSPALRFGRVLFLTEAPVLLRAQFDGVDLDWDAERALISAISTDEITPNWACFHYDEKLAGFAFVGLRGDVVSHGDIAGGGFEVIVSGPSKGCGSSRENAPFAEKAAGARLIIAPTIEKIYRQNCQNIGLFTSTDMGLVPRILAGETIPLSELTDGLDEVSADIVRRGGLLAYAQARLDGRVTPTLPTTSRRPMTLAEKVLARRTVRDPNSDDLGVDYVAPGDAIFVRANVRFSHEYVTPLASTLFHGAFGDAARVSDPSSIVAFRDHLTFLGEAMTPKQRASGLLEQANGLATTQEAFCARHGIRLYGEVAAGGSEAICHNAVLDELVRPGDVVVGTDSHTCTAGALGAVAFGVGATDMATGWRTRDFRVRVPETVRVDLTGRLPGDCAAKDVMLAILALDYFKASKAVGQMLEVGGAGVATLVLDERATLTNMAVEGGAFSGIIAADDAALAEVAAMRGASDADVRGVVLQADPDAQYAARFTIDLDALRPMVATPGDPRNGVPVSDIAADAVSVDIAYGGSCTGGKRVDMDLYAKVLAVAHAQGKTVAPGVQLFIQFGSQDIRRYAEAKGYIELFTAVGARLVNPSCGACVRAGPGVSLDASQTTISAINRNFPGRCGPGEVYLASPLVVAASAIAGHIIEPRELDPSLGPR